MIAYKLFRIKKNGDISSLFINKRESYKFNVWMEAKSYPTKGYSYRPYWHCTEKPSAPHLSMKNRVWVEIEMDEYVEFKRPESQGGRWFLAKKIKLIKMLKGGIEGCCN